MSARSAARQYLWIAAASGVVAILFGLAAMLWPGLTLMVLTTLFGIFAIVEGTLALVATYRAARRTDVWWPSLLVGLLGLLAGIVALAYPGITALVLLYIIAAWAIAVGLVQIISAILVSQWLPAVVGAVSVVFGLLLLTNPGRGALALVLVIGAFAIVRGIVQVAAAVRLPTTS